MCPTNEAGMPAESVPVSMRYCLAHNLHPAHSGMFANVTLGGVL